MRSFFTFDKGITEEARFRQILQRALLVGLFVLVTLGVFLALQEWYPTQSGATDLQTGFFNLGGALLLAGLATAVAAALRCGPRREERPVWHAPLLAAAVSLCLLVLGYAFLGVWPLGEKSILMVDMHHQYAPLMSELRHMLLHGGDFSYSFNIGLGASFVPTFAYYLASPLNILLVLFSERHLTEAILVITLLKVAGSAASFTALAQYLYGRRTGTVMAVGVLYSLTGYMLAYSWNIMWLDVVALLPVVVLALEHLLRTGRVAPYAGLLALALFANYYIGFMLCMFLVLYALVWLLRERHTGRQIWGGGLRFAAGSLWGAGMAAALLIPTALALGRTSAAGEELGQFATNFPLFDLLGRFFYGAEPTIRSGNLPNLYCGVAAVVLLPIYLTQKNIPLRRRLSYGGLLLALVCSCTLTQWDLVWHGLHSPNDLPYRFSFLVCFVVLLMAAHALTHLERITPRQILSSLAASAGYLILWEKLGKMFQEIDPDAAEKVITTPKLLYANLLLLVIYGAVLLVGTALRTPRRVASRLVLLAVCAELLFATSGTLIKMNSNEYFTRHQDYTYNMSHSALDAALRRAEELAAEDAENFGAFVRMEYLPRTSCVDTSLHHYSGLTTFASSNPYLTTKFMGELGYAVNGVNSYLFHSYVAPVDSLFALRYVILEKKITGHAQLELLDSVAVYDKKTSQTHERFIYRNRLALPVGFAVDAAIADYSGNKYAPFASQQMLYQSMTGCDAEIYIPMTITTDSEGATIRGSSLFMPNNNETALYEAAVEEQGQYFAYVDCRAADTIMVSTYDDTQNLKNSWGVTNHEPYIIDMGTLTPGDIVEVSLSGDTSATGNIYLMRLDPDALEQHLSILRQGGLQVTEQTGHSLEGTITADEDGAIFFSLPYDKGWQVLVDGQPAETFPISDNSETVINDDGTETVTGGDDGALLGVRLTAGTHTVVLTYRTPGQLLGVLISAVCLLLLAAPAAVRWILRRRQKAPAAEEETPAETSPTEEIPEEETPAEAIPAEETPVEETVAENTPAETPEE